MKKHLLLLAIFFLAMCSVQVHGQTRKRVAVVLSGGGAKGMAHIGALKVIERAGIPIDIITGTSMGSIVGGLYAIGYNAESLDSLVRQQDWTFLLSDRENLEQQRLSDREKASTYILSKSFNLKKRDVANSGIIKGKNLADLFQKVVYGYSDSLDFNQLPIRFACVATDIVTNTEYDFHSGYIAQAMRASMAIPAVFAPVRKGDMVLVDGGLCNNYPADVARRMGADVIIGVTVQGEEKTADDLGSTASILAQIIDVNCKNKYEENLAITDVPIRVNTKGYTAASFTTVAIDTLIRRGEEEAMNHWDDLLALKRKIGLPDDYKVQLLQPKNGGVLNEQYKINHIRYENLSNEEISYLQRKFHLKRLSSISTEQAELVTTSMRLDLYYQNASYRVDSTANGYDLTFIAGEKTTIQAALGMRFDNEEMAALQLNAEIPLRYKWPMDLDLTLRLGRRIMGRVALSLPQHNFLRPQISYTYRHNDINIYEKGNKDYNITYDQHTLDLNLIRFDIRNLTFDISARLDFYHYEDLLIDHKVKTMTEQLSNDHYITYSAQAHYNSESSAYFPHRGARFLARYAYVTNNLTHLHHHHGMSEGMAAWRINLPLGSRFTLQPMLYSRMLFGSQQPSVLSNAIGGPWFHQYIEQQLPFAGVGRVEHIGPYFVASQIQGQQHIGTNNYVLLQLAAGQQSDRFSELFEHSLMYGGTLSYYYNTQLGPLGASIGYSNRTSSLNFYINLGFVF